MYLMISGIFFSRHRKWKMKLQQKHGKPESQLVHKSIRKTEKIELTSYDKSYVFKAIGYNRVGNV